VLNWFRFFYCNFYGLLQSGWWQDLSLFFKAELPRESSRCSAAQIGHIYLLRFYFRGFKRTPRGYGRGAAPAGGYIGRPEACPFLEVRWSPEMPPGPI
jgi:hypothetical protein